MKKMVVALPAVVATAAIIAYIGIFGNQEEQSDAAEHETLVETETEPLNLQQIWEQRVDAALSRLQGDSRPACRGRKAHDGTLS
jgi:hypothetical protein